ncbi:MAG: tetratricopeptide repeat protein, partial [Bacteroidetes bacterium]|nr:tetratricopeptide repeat protein [Bacteroidota bacterium]
MKTAPLSFPIFQKRALILTLFFLAVHIHAQTFKDLTKQAFEKASTGDYEAALADYDQAILLNDQNANAFYYQGVCHF